MISINGGDDMRRMKTLGSGLVVAVVLVTCGDYLAFAATGDSLLLGKVNHSRAVTTIDRTTNGAALKLSTNNPGAAPLVTNGHGRVANLNADQVDGKHAAAFAPIAHAPVAAGHVTAGGTLVNGWGVSGVSWDESGKRYLLPLTGGREASYLDYGVIATPVCADHNVSYASAADILTVTFYNATGVKFQCGFAFVIVKF
jgi:hypothetical protein